jgi:hypothetical protein
MSSVSGDVYLAGLHLCFASFDKREGAGEMEKPDALDLTGFTNGNGVDKTFGCPLVELWARAIGIELMPAPRCPEPQRQVAVRQSVLPHVLLPPGQSKCILRQMAHTIWGV